jgi:hypothetical protein
MKLKMVGKTITRRLLPPEDNNWYHVSINYLWGNHPITFMYGTNNPDANVQLIIGNPNIFKRLIGWIKGLPAYIKAILYVSKSNKQWEKVNRKGEI